MKPLVGTMFDLTLADGTQMTMKLDDAMLYTVTARRQRSKPKREPFALYFLGDPSVVLPQNMYTLRSEALTLENVFIVPIGHDDEATEYEAVFT